MDGKIKTVLLLLVLTSVLLAGCSGGQPESEGEGVGAAETTPTEPPSGGSSNPYDTANEVSPPSEAADIHNMVKPILESVFGGAKLTGYLSGQGTGGKGISLVYVVRDPIDSAKIQELKNRIASQGYTSLYGGMEDNSFGFQFMKDNNVLLVGGEIDTHEITVVWGQGS